MGLEGIDARRLKENELSERVWTLTCSGSGGSGLSRGLVGGVSP